MIKVYGIFMLESGLPREYRKLLPVHFPGNDHTDNIAGFPTPEAAEKGLEQAMGMVDTQNAAFVILPVYRAD